MRIGSSTKRSPYHPNEDRVLLIKDLGEACGYPLEATALVAMCDGHGGARCAEYLSRQFPRDLMARAGTHLASSDPGLGAARLSNLSTALSLGFQETEERWMALARRRRDSSGACFTAILIRGRRVAVANVGDCRAVYRERDGTLTELTTDHRCSLQTERTRIRAAGGFIRENRVLGILEPTRTIGDLDEKAMPGVVVATPDVQELVIPEDAPGRFPPAPKAKSKSSRRGFRSMGRTLGSLPRVGSHSRAADCSLRVLIVATDGVWDALDSPAAMAIVCSVLESSCDSQAAALALNRAAAAAGSVDDISSAVVWFA